ncbi:hypothetical protein CUR178_04100 [Leishmania enriettii]|uniref:Uncharacterized protein n=1 Tax=Leishmania enriettii TaxID=5663 RepID=A0A836KF69_LEIEN|nr:hypothetical protein CUR178_04100 [Leishmania enriettii]
MGKNASDEARQRNGTAVQRMFQKSASQRARIAAHIHCAQDGRTTARRTSDGHDMRGSAGPSLRVSSTSAAALVGATGGDRRSVRPAWCDPDRGKLLSPPTLGVSSDPSRQVGVDEHVVHLPAAQQQPRLVCDAPVRQPTSAAPREEAGDACRSCFILALQKSKHARGIDTWPADAALTPYEAHKAQLRAYHHQQAVLRHERTIPRRRAIDPYVHLTGAQVDACLTVPNTYTADRLAEHSGGRWVLDNPHRQQLYKGEPVMTRIMRGEFYSEGAARRAAGVPRFDLLAKNRRDVRVTSAINRAERQRHQLPACRCVCSK